MGLVAPVWGTAVVMYVALKLCSICMVVILQLLQLINVLLFCQMKSVNSCGGCDTMTAFHLLLLIIITINNYCCHFIVNFHASEHVVTCISNSDFSYLISTSVLKLMK